MFGKLTKYNPRQISLTDFFAADVFMQDVCDIIKQSIIDKDRSATGKAVKSLRPVMTSERQWSITGNSYISRIQEGNPPNKGRRVAVGRSRWMTSPEINLADKLQDGWLQARNIPLEAAYPIAKSIISKGDKTYQAGGQDIWSSNVVDFIDKHTADYINIESYLDFDYKF